MRRKEKRNRTWICGLEMGSVGLIPSVRGLPKHYLAHEGCTASHDCGKNLGGEDHKLAEDSSADEMTDNLLAVGRRNQSYPYSYQSDKS